MYLLFLQEKIFENFQKIKLKPDQFTEFLLSREVGFSKCELLDIPFNKSKGNLCQLETRES